MSTLLNRVGIQQRVLPKYRVPFFELLAQAYPGGLQVFAGQPRRGETIEVADTLDPDRYISGRNIHLLAGKPYFYIQPRLVGWLRQFQPSTLVVEINARNRSLGAAIRWMRTSGGVVVGWGLGSPEHAGALAQVAEASKRALLNHLDVVIAYSLSGAREYTRLGFPAERIIVAPNAVIQPLGELHRRRPTHATPENLVVMFVGRLQLRKRVDLLLHAVAELPTQTRPRLWIIGDGPERPNLEALSSQLTIDTRFFGNQYGDPLAALYAQADLFVLPGTGGLALQQAMAHGLPVIAAEGDGTQQDLVRPETGWLVEPGDLASLKMALTKALAHPERLESYGRNAWRLMKDEVNLNVMVVRFQQAIQIAMEVRHARAGRR